MALKDLMGERISKLEKLLAWKKDPFSIKSAKHDTSLADIRKKYAQLSGETSDNYNLVGRVMSKRDLGKIAFLDISDQSATLQIIFRKNTTSDFDSKDLVDIGDFIHVYGNVIRTNRGELSLVAHEFAIISKALRPLPDKWKGLEDTEARYRQRYVDFVVNSEARNKILTTAKINQIFRRELLAQNYIEVNTPILQPIYGGAFARPFKTFHHDLKSEMYLRVAPELYLKRLIVGGFERVFEFAPCFRNESIDTTHNPEFVQIELYEAYSDYTRMMEIVEHLISTAALELFGSYEFEYQGVKINTKPPWPRVRMIDAISKYGGPDVEKMTFDELKSYCAELDITGERRGDLIEELFSYYAQPKLIQPTFITHFPKDISPLSKESEVPGYAERFEAYMAGMEFANAFSELNNPIEQYKRFKEEEELRAKVQKEGLEYMPMDKDYIRALEYSMPPTAGLGLGLGRVHMIFTNSTSIKEVLPFPAVSSKESINVAPELFPQVLEWYD